MNSVVVKAGFVIYVLVLLSVFVSGCKSSGNADSNNSSAVAFADSEDAYRVIGDNLDALYDDLKTLERLYGKPLDQRIYDTLAAVKKNVKEQDYEKSIDLDWKTLCLLKDHLVDESLLEEYIQLLGNIKRWVAPDGPCQNILDDLRKLRTETILRGIIIPEVTFRPPDTLIDACDFFKQASRDYYSSKGFGEQYGVSFVLMLRSNRVDTEAGADDDPFAVANNNVPVIPALSARFISLYDALTLVCDVTGYKLNLRGGIVMLVPDDEIEDPKNGDCDAGEEF